MKTPDNYRSGLSVKHCQIPADNPFFKGLNDVTELLIGRIISAEPTICDKKLCENFIINTSRCIYCILVAYVKRTPNTYRFPAFSEKHVGGRKMDFKE